MDELTALGIKHGTNKATRHKYTPIYHSLFSPFRFRRVVLLEIGVQRCKSVWMWRDYFPGGQIYGIDKSEESQGCNGKRIKVFQGLQEDTAFLHDVLEEIESETGKPPEIVIDDGGHKMEQQHASFRFIFRCLLPGSFYVVEDTHTSFWPKWGGGYRRIGTFIEHVKDLIDGIHGKWHEHPVSTEARMIEWVWTHPGLVVFRKAV